jgi:hypothetical protein
MSLLRALICFVLMALAQAAISAPGDLDPSFAPNVTGDAYTAVYAIAVQPDGMIVIGGHFTAVGGVTRNNAARLYPDGTLDSNFDPEVGGSFVSITKIAVQADGKILVGGLFSTVDGVARNNIARLNPLIPMVL